MTLLETQDYLDSFINYEREPRKNFPSSFHLVRIRELLSLMGDPHNDLKIIHIAGSKGKGSTAVMTAHVLKKAGYKVGLYTSPHIYNYRERIRVLDKQTVKKDKKNLFPDQISEEKLTELIEKLMPIIENVRRQESEIGPLSFFEVYTALALYYFREVKTDVVILETGLGGRLDATNIVSSMICVITPISMEHTEILGKTIKQIAQEKAAIIKDNGQKVVIAKQCDEALEVLHQRCQEFNITQRYVVIDPETIVENRSLDSQSVNLKLGSNRYRNIRMSLVGDHQLLNAKVVVNIVEALKELGYRIGLQAIYEGLKDVRFPGRLEMVRKTPPVIIDAAHNKDSMEKFVNTILQIYPTKKFTIVLGTSNDKDKLGIGKELRSIARRVIATKANHPRAAEWTNKDLNQYFPINEYYLTETVDEAMTMAYQKTPPGEMILVTGSVFVISEARKLCVNQR